MNIDETATTFTEPWLEPKPSTLNPKTQTLPKVRLDSGLPRELFLQPKPRLPAVLKGFLAVLWEFFNGSARVFETITNRRI